MLKEELAAAGVRQLRDIARDVGITMPQKLRKEELIEQIVERMQQQGRSDLPQIVPMKKRGQKSKSEREAIAAQEALEQAAAGQAQQEEPAHKDEVQDQQDDDVFAPQRHICTVSSQTLVHNGFEPRHYDNRVGETRANAPRREYPAPRQGAPTQQRGGYAPRYERAPRYNNADNRYNNGGENRYSNADNRYNNGGENRYNNADNRYNNGGENRYNNADNRYANAEGRYNAYNNTDARAQSGRMQPRTQPRPRYAPARAPWDAQGESVPPKNEQDAYTVMAQRYGDTLALHRASAASVQNNDALNAEAGQDEDDMTFVAPQIVQQEFRPDMAPAAAAESVEGVLEILPDGYGFVRVTNYCPGPQDAYVSLPQIKRLGLRAGDYLCGQAASVRPREKRRAMQTIESVNGVHVSPDLSEPIQRVSFDSLVPIYPQERLVLECPDAQDASLRLLDLLAPIGKGQRGLIVAPPKSGKTVLLQHIAQSIKKNDPDVALFMLLIDERPEEVTDMQRSVDGEVVYSTFDEQPERHIRVAELLIERAKRLVEQGKDVVILLDSITRLARAYNLTSSSGGKILSGGLDSAALFKPKWFFGAARNIENGASLTIIATALVDTGSRLDDVIYEEFKGTGNMEVFLDRKLSQKRIFPAIDLLLSGTRHEELLLDEQELSCAREIRRLLGGAGDATETLIDMVIKTPDNKTFFKRFADWRQIWAGGQNGKQN